MEPDFRLHLGWSQAREGGVSTLYLDRKGFELELDSGALVLRCQGQLAGRVPLNLLEQVVISAETQLSSSLLARLAHEGVVTALVLPRSGAAAYVIGGPRGIGRRRLAQYKAASDDTLRLRYARRVVEAKVRSQMRLLAGMADGSSTSRGALRTACDSLSRALKKLQGGQIGNLDELRGLEGHAAAVYFRAYARLFPDSLGFKERRRRPPTDPVNAALSLGYTLLFGRAMGVVLESSLDPFIGFLHDPAHGRPSLACDLMEPLRTRVDRVVWLLFHDRALRPHDFRVDQGRCLMGKAARREFYQHLEPVMARAGRVLTRAARALVRALDKSVPELAVAREDEFDEL